MVAVIAHRLRNRQDPEVEGKRMSEWAFSVIAPGDDHEGSYGYQQKSRQVFSEHARAAIPQLIAAVRYPSKLEGAWLQLNARLPNGMKLPWVKRRLIAYRWRAILALSDLAKRFPEPEIVTFFHESVHHQNSSVRKITAYESGPWLDPVHPENVIAIIEIALRDAQSEVRRDALRRIAESATAKNSAYTAAAQRLRDTIELAFLRDVNFEVRSNSAKALQRLSVEPDK